MSVARDIDASKLPKVAFDSRSLMWWGILGFLAFETTMLAICLVSYFYLRGNEWTWPPAPVAPPNLAAGTATTLLLLASLVPMIWLDRVARRFELRRTLIAHALCVALGVAFMVTRWLELQRLNVRWDTNAYGSVVWMIIGVHTAHLLAEVVETAYFTCFLAKHPKPNYFTDATDNALYWYFIVGIWIPCYVTIYLVPRWG